MKKPTAVTLLVVGTNFLTASVLTALFSKVHKDAQEEYNKMARTALIHRKAVLMFANATPREIAKPILDEIEFDWVVRDLV